MVRQFSEPTAPPEQRRPMTYEQWLAWSGESRLSEWVDGEAIDFMTTTVTHGRVVAFLITLLKMYVELRDLGEILAAPVELRLVPGRISREPDVLFVAHANRHRVTDCRVEGSADLVIEVVSDDSVRRDYDIKRSEYQAAGVPEYWLFDPRPHHHRAEFFRRSSDGGYLPAPPDPDGRYRSRSLPGFWLRPDWLWREPLPTVRDSLAEIAPDFLAPSRAGRR